MTQSLESDGQLRMLIMGPPGAGKGTQSKIVAEHYQVPAISTGDIFRANVAQRTALGIQAQQIMDAGGYVGDDLTNQIVADRLAQPDAARGFLLDGYPRTLGQVEALDAMVAGPLTAVISLLADTEEVVDRLRRRADQEGRADDNEDAIRVRLQVYAEQTQPLIDLYRERGVLIEVDGLGEIDDVSTRLIQALDERLPAVAPGGPGEAAPQGEA